MTLLLAVLIASLLSLTLVFFLLQLYSTRRTLPVTAEWIDQLSVDRYRPMLRLLDESDLEYLRWQPGATPRMVARLRRQRCQIFRGYLQCLEADFQRTCTALKLLMVQSRYDRPELASVLVRAQVDFACGMLLVRLRLVLFRLGVASVDVRGVMRLFDGLRVELRTLVPASRLA